MTLALLVPIAILGFLLWVEKRDRREAEQAWRLERVGLLQRIQAPELAIAQASEPPSGEPLYVPLDDQALWDEYAEERQEGKVS